MRAVLAAALISCTPAANPVAPDVHCASGQTCPAGWTCPLPWEPNGDCIPPTPSPPDIPAFLSRDGGARAKDGGS